MSSNNIDWLNASDGEVAALYQTAKYIRDKRDISWEKFYDLCLLRKFRPGSVYEDNFRAGKISRKKAHQIASWIDVNHPEKWADFDDAVDSKLSKEEFKANENSWEEFVQTRGQFGFVKIATKTTGTLTAVKIADGDPIVREILQLGELFYFDVECPQSGSVVVLQKVRSDWSCLPLAVNEFSVPVVMGRQRLPLESHTGEELFLEDTDESGLHKFVFLISDRETILSIEKLVPNPHALSNKTLHSVAQALVSRNSDSISLLRLNVRFRG